MLPAMQPQWGFSFASVPVGGTELVNSCQSAILSLTQIEQSNKSFHFSHVLQLAFGIAASSLLLVDESAYNALDQKSIWIVVTGECACGRVSVQSWN